MVIAFLRFYFSFFIHNPLVMPNPLYLPPYPHLIKHSERFSRGDQLYLMFDLLYYVALDRNGVRTSFGFTSYFGLRTFLVVTRYFFFRRLQILQCSERNFKSLSRRDIRSYWYIVILSYTVNLTFF
jgi:hypothetical protein